MENVLLNTYSPSSFFKEDWPMIDFLCPALGLTAGPPSLLYAYGYTGKTLVAQLLCLAVASGTDFLGMPVRKGKVLHIDMEQGREETSVRYRRLANGADLAPEDVVDLEAVSYPQFRLDQKDAEGILTEAVQGKALCLIDSLRAAISGDENASESRASLDMLGRVSEKTRCVFLVIHHSGKGERLDARQSARGTSAFYDAISVGLALAKDKDANITLVQTKTRNVIHSGGIVLKFADAGEWISQIHRTEGLAISVVENAKPKPLTDQVLEMMKAAGAPVSREQIRAALRCRSADLGLALLGLTASGRVERFTEGRLAKFRLVERDTSAGATESCEQDDQK